MGIIVKHLSLTNQLDLRLVSHLRYLNLELSISCSEKSSLKEQITLHQELSLALSCGFLRHIVPYGTQIINAQKDAYSEALVH